MTPRRSGGFRAESASSLASFQHEITRLDTEQSNQDIRVDSVTDTSQAPDGGTDTITNTLDPATNHTLLPDLPMYPVESNFDKNCFMFFEPSNDSLGQNQDLHWLFDSISQDLDFGDPFLNQAAVLSASPLSTSSHQSTNESSTIAGDPWPAVRCKLLTALQSLPTEILQDSFFESTNLQSFHELYFKHYNAHFPILHEASFVPDDVPALLLVALLTLGATLSSHERHFQVSQKIHDSLRWLIFGSEAFQPPAPLWCVQALLLVQAHEKMFSSRKHHEMAHIFHGSIITLMRRGSSYNSEWAEETHDGSSLERAWHLWVEKESSKRAAYFAFIMDAQHASVFGHVPALSVSDLRLPLPSPDAMWDASSPSRWKTERNKTVPEPSFLQVLRTLLARRPLPAALSPFARFVVLHGLFSVTKHMQYRDLATLDVDAESAPENHSPNQTSSLIGPVYWREVLDRAIETWSLSLLSQGPALCLEAAMPLQRIAHISIHLNLIDFHILAGAPFLTGNKVSPTEYAQARDRCQQWSESQSARRTLSHCLLLVQETMFRRRHYRASEDNIALRPWCLYHSTLILWAYGVFSSITAQNYVLSAEEYIVYMLNGLMEGSTQLADAGSTSGLVIAVRDALSDCRWELLQEAHATLNRLLESP
ncbi:hypothetical protein LTR05_003893 [Lithohypha guttulata]|uniref:Xylanolytic transcriptional activator regulatory domain-containing protein n=1 Tax=Lithohypha guttulata TaxID=1690604 RepID=A0AAN7Y7B0_9EURO|nr:hypothetical protein LTR05_003893 [Lithohypha guttulata]